MPGNEGTEAVRLADAVEGRVLEHVVAETAREVHRYVV